MSSSSRSFAREMGAKGLPMPETEERRVPSASSGIRARSDTASSSASSSSFPSTMQAAGDDVLGQSMLGLSLESSPSQQARALSPSLVSFQAGAPALTAPLPTLLSLQDFASSVRLPSSSTEMQIKWIRDVLFLVNRTCAPSAAASADPQIGPIVIDDPSLFQLAESAVELLLSLIPSIPSPGTKLTPPIAEALYLRASLTASGAFPVHLPENPRVAFRAFEASARAGHFAAWFKLGRTYEGFDESKRAKDCFERGAKSEDVGCLYRLGMAHLMGQLGIPLSPAAAVQFIFSAAERASIALPQPAYVYASLLLGDFAHTCATLPASVFLPNIPSGSTIEQEARRFLERAAYLHFVPAQYKLGHFYEFARAPYAYDPLLSVQYHTLASDLEPEASLALSKWFLCGAEGVFEKDEQLARDFAERAARAGLPSAEFAMGYYWEVGIGSSKDMRRARRWYEKASAHGNSDAADRLASLAQSSASSLSREDHDTLAEQTLVRRRTQAKQRSEAAGSIRRGGSREDAVQVVELVRRVSKIQPRAVMSERSSVSSGPTSIAESVRSGRSNSEGLPEIDKPVQQHHAETMPAPALAPPYFPEKKRYSLVDSGPSSRAASPRRVNARTGAESQTPPLRYGSPSPARTSRSRSEATSSTLSIVLSESPMPSPGLDAAPVASPPRVRYNTFAEMGIQGQKLEEKECVIM